MISIISIILLHKIYKRYPIKLYFLNEKEKERKVVTSKERS